MDKMVTYENFNTYSTSEKIDFFDDGIVDVINSMDNQKLYKFFKNIILNIDENSYVRVCSQKYLTESVFLNKIKIRQAMNILLDEWSDTKEVHLEAQRLKDLFYFFGEEPDSIEKIYESFLENEELEIATEAYYNLGLIYIQKGLTESNNDIRLSYFKRSKCYLSEADSLIENRVDARFFGLISTILIDLLVYNLTDVKSKLEELRLILEDKNKYSFDFNLNKCAIDIGFYTILSSLINIITENPERWSNYHIGFSKLYNYCSEIKNQEIKDRLNQSALSKLLIDTSFEKIEPYFAYNMQAQLVKIDVCISECEDKPQLKDFLINLKSMAEKNISKKKNNPEELEELIKKNFPKISPKVISDKISKIINIEDPFKYIKLITELSTPTHETFFHILLACCANLQGSRKYWFRKNQDDKIGENDRNDFIAKLLNQHDQYYVEPQTRWSKSSEGKEAGELDIFVRIRSSNLPFTIIEALNLNSVLKEEIAEHIDKLMNDYDANGLACNYILVYCNVAKFIDFFKGYNNYVSVKHNYTYKLIDSQVNNNVPFSEIKVIENTHIRNENETKLIHILINLRYNKS